MRILLYSSAFNSLTQRAAAELTYAGHDLAVALDLGGGEAGATELRAAVERHRPELVIAPMLTTGIPEDVWSERICLIVHPGPPGDRGPSSLDWALSQKADTWGVTALQAVATMDAGPVWAWEPFDVPEGISKGALYRGEVTDAAMAALLRAVDRVASGQAPSDPPPGSTRPYYQQHLRAIDWSRDSAASISCALLTADSSPGVVDEIEGSDYFLYGGQIEDELTGEPGVLVATRDGAVCRATADGAAVWLTSVRPRRLPGQPPTAKAPAATALAHLLGGVPEVPAELVLEEGRQTCTVVRYREHGPVGHLLLEPPAGALSADHCRRLLDALAFAAARPTRVLVLDHGRAMATGIHLGAIQAAEDPAAATWETIQAIDDVAEAILDMKDKVTVAALGAGGAAGGLMLALTCDEVWVRSGSVLDPHYRTLGLYGSELWTLTLPQRVGHATAERLTSEALPISADHAFDLGLVDRVVDATPVTFPRQVLEEAEALALEPDFEERLRDKHAAAPTSEQIAGHREAELAQMHRCIYGAGKSYHDLREEFMFKTRPTTTPARLSDLPAVRPRPPAMRP